MKIFGFQFPKKKISSSEKSDNSNSAAIEDSAALPIDALANYVGSSNFANTVYDGEKFPGGFGSTNIYQLDYWELRAKSSQLFTENLYARGVINRLLTHEINVGLSPEAIPDEAILGFKEQSLNVWTENVESRFEIWASNPELCDYKKQKTLRALQHEIRLEALINGDVLVVLRQTPHTKLPAIQIISGDNIQTPFGQKPSTLRKKHKITHGVEVDNLNRTVAYWVKQADLTFKRIPAKGEKTGRRISWLVFGGEKRLNELRGQPLLAVILQSLKEIDRYRDSAQRKALVNSILAMFIKKTEDKMSSLPVTGGAVRRDQTTVAETDGKKRKYDISQQYPGVVFEELQKGEEPVGFHSQGTDINFPGFEKTIIDAIAWSIEIPPEVLKLEFNKSFSASTAANNAFKIYIDKIWREFGDTVLNPIYQEWLLSEILMKKIIAPGLLAAWRDPAKYDIWGAWTQVEWYGSVKLSSDTLKQAKGSESLIKQGLTTRARESRNTTGTKYSKNVQRLLRENQLLVESARPLAEFLQEFGPEITDQSINAQSLNNLEILIDERLEEKESIPA